MWTHVSGHDFAIIMFLYFGIFNELSVYDLIYLVPLFYPVISHDAVMVLLFYLSWQLTTVVEYNWFWYKS